jgi:hypothetical protein
MIYFKFTIGIFCLFLVPYYISSVLIKSNSVIRYSLTFVLMLLLFYGYFLFTNYYYFKNSTFVNSVYTGAVLSLLHAAYYGRMRILSKFAISMLLASCFLFPLIFQFGDVFHEWDAVASWNSWAVDIYKGRYVTGGTAYPVLMSSIIASIYAFQGTDQIWWTAKAFLIFIPVFFVLISVSMALKFKDNFSLWLLLFSYTYLTNHAVTSGYVDLPVAIIGMTSMLLLYDHFSRKDINSLLIAVILGGISALMKQSGYAYLGVALIYVMIFLLSQYKVWSSVEFFKIFFICLISVLIPYSFLLYHSSTNDSSISNLSYLLTLTSDVGFSQRLMNFMSVPKIILNLRFDWILLPLLLYFFIKYLFNSNNCKFKKLAFFYFLFFVIGCSVWYFAFSYDGRNAVWAKVFLIFSGSIATSRLYGIRKYTKPNDFLETLTYRIGGALAILFLCFSVYASAKGDSYSYLIQEKGQSNIGNPNVAKKLVMLLGSSDQCSVVYSNRLLLLNNFFLRDHVDKLDINAWDVKGVIGRVDRSCSMGSYLAFGEWSKRDVNWSVVEAMVLDGQLIISDSALGIYFWPGLVE